MTLRFNDGGFTIVEKLFKALREILQHWRLSLASLLFYILLLLLTNVCRENFLVLATNITTISRHNPRLPCSLALTLDTVINPSPCSEGSQCYTLRNRTDVEAICNLTVECRTRSSLEFNLDTCPWRTRMNLVHVGNNTSDCLSMDKEGCSSCLQGLLDRGRGVQKHFEKYSSILSRYDCNRNYSMWNCDRCKDVYQDWLCGISFDFYDKGRRIKPCLDFCYETSRKCPFLLPAVQYCGIQSFFCPVFRDLRHVRENSTYAYQAPCFECSYKDSKLGTKCEAKLTNKTNPLGGSASATKASITSLLIGQLVSLWIWRTLFDLPPGFV